MKIRRNTATGFIRLYPKNTLPIALVKRHLNKVYEKKSPNLEYIFDDYIPILPRAELELRTRRELELTTPVTPILLVTKDDVVVIREAEGALERDKGGDSAILFMLLDFKEANCWPDNLITLKNNNINH